MFGHVCSLLVCWSLLCILSFTQLWFCISSLLSSFTKLIIKCWSSSSIHNGERVDMPHTYPNLWTNFLIMYLSELGHSDPAKLKDTAQDVKRLSPSELKKRQEEIKVQLWCISVSVWKLIKEMVKKWTLCIDMYVHFCKFHYFNEIFII